MISINIDSKIVTMTKNSDHASSSDGKLMFSKYVYCHRLVFCLSFLIVQWESK